MPVIAPLKTILVLLAMLLPSALNAESPSFAAIRSRVAADCAVGRFSGVVAAVRRGRVVYRQVCGYADAARRQPLDFGARFKFFSLSKSFTATAIMRLVERGRISLDGSILTYLPDAPGTWRAVTVRHLLQHQSGIPDLTESLLGAYQTGGALTHRAAMRIVLAGVNRGTPLADPPGTRWAYSNFGFELLASIAEAVEGRPFAEIMRREVLTPAGMTGATLEQPMVGGGPLASAPSPRLVPGYNGSPGHWAPARSLSFVQQGAGAMHGNYRDLVRFTLAMQSGRLLSQAAQAMNVRESVPVSETARYGFGWLIRTSRDCTYWQHSGGTNGYVAEFALAPEHGTAVIVLSNLGFAEVSAIRRALIEALLPTADRHGCGQG